MNSTLKSLAPYHIDVTLDHPAFRTKESGFRVTSQPTSRRERTGRLSTGTVRRAFPGTVRLPAGGEVSGLHPAIRHCAQVKQLIRRGLVEVVDVEVPASSTPALSAPGETSASSGRRRAKVQEPPAGD